MKIESACLEQKLLVAWVHARKPRSETILCVQVNNFSNNNSNQRNMAATLRHRSSSRRNKRSLLPTVSIPRPKCRTFLSSCFLLIIAGLVIFQFAAFSNHTKRFGNSHAGGGGGLHQTLLEHKQKSAEHHRARRQQRGRQNQPAPNEEEPRNLEDATPTEDNKMTPDDRENRRRLNSTKGGQDKAADHHRKANAGDAAADDKRNHNNLERQQAPVKAFKMKRSHKQPPADHNERTKPLDPLGPHLDISTLTPTKYTLRSKWHGVLLDAGRHYFEVDWIKRMLDVLSILQYNCLHFRLTDDQAFNVKLKSQPDLAHHVGLFGNDKVYTPEELRDIVAYAKTKGITIWPEINVPGHGGGWAGIPGLIVQCPEFICEKGYGVPINVTHPQFRPVLTDVLSEIIEIFDNPPYLHLGGDEVDMAQPCFAELNKKMFNYDVFEKSLEGILKDIGYPEEQVIRWEMTGQRLKSQRAGKMPQYWFRVPGESAPNMGHNGFLASGGLYFDFNEMDMAWQVYLNTRRYYHLPKDNFPIGIIVGTFELDANFWYDRNVVGRLLAVTMAASKEVDAGDGSELFELYRDACQGVGFEPALCQHYGLPFISWKAYKEKWNKVWTQWKGRICERLTTSIDTLEYATTSATRDARRQPLTGPGDALHSTWEYFGKPSTLKTIDVPNELAIQAVEAEKNLKSLTKRLVPGMGIIADLSQNRPHGAVIGPGFHLLHQMHALGFDLIQVQLVNDRAFVYKSNVVPHAHNPAEAKFALTLELLNKTLVPEANKLGIGIVPEIALTTGSSGAYKMGYQMRCPVHICETGTAVQNINQPDYTAVAYSLIREVHQIATSGVVHLGGDDRQVAAACFEELSQEPDFELFESKLSYLLSFDGIPNSKIMRWSNDESVEYKGRVGSITQCKEGDCRTDDTQAWAATVDIQIGGPFDVYQAARNLALLKPDSIFAEVGHTDSTANHGSTVDMRMLAFAMGVSQMDEMTQESFEAAFIPMCKTILEVDIPCKAFAKSHESARELVTRSSPEQTSAICQERTRQVKKHKYRPEFQEAEVSTFNSAFNSLNKLF